MIPTTLNASALRDPEGRVIGAIGILRDMRAYEKVVRDLEQSKSELQEKILDLEKFEEVVVGRELKMIALEKEIEALREVDKPGGAPFRVMEMISPEWRADRWNGRRLSTNVTRARSNVWKGGSSRRGATARHGQHHERPGGQQPAP